jgi:restriction system protein
MLWFLIPIAILTSVFRSPWFKGFIGEVMVNLAAKLWLDKTKYHVLKNVTLPTDDGTTQIDHIIISKYGVFVVETKNMKGWIFGSQNQKVWTQQIFKDKSKFQNPIHQNYKHVKTLESLLELTEEQIFSVIVFVGNSKFKTELPENVTYTSGYIRYIKSKKKEVLTGSKVTQIIKQIELGRLVPSFKTDKEHVKHVKNIIVEKHNKKSCPKCGSEMVIRKAKQGTNKGNSFWGCTNFPKCRCIVNVT